MRKTEYVQLFRPNRHVADGKGPSNQLVSFHQTLSARSPKKMAADGSCHTLALDYLWLRMSPSDVTSLASPPFRRDKSFMLRPHPEANVRTKHAKPTLHSCHVANLPLWSLCACVANHAWTRWLTVCDVTSKMVRPRSGVKGLLFVMGVCRKFGR